MSSVAATKFAVASHTHSPFLQPKDRAMKVKRSSNPSQSFQQQAVQQLYRTSSGQGSFYRTPKAMHLFRPRTPPDLAKSLKLPSPVPPKQQKHEWPLWAKVLAVAAGCFATGVLIKSGWNYFAGYRPDIHSDPKMCDPNESISAISTNSCVPKNMLNFFNRYFPNTVVVGADDEVGQETLKWLDHLGVEARPEKTYDKSTVPFDVWNHVKEFTVSADLHKKISDAITQGRTLTLEEAEGANKLRGAAACYLVHRRAILDTIDKYENAKKKYDECLKNKSAPDHANQLKYWKKEMERYSSIFVFEHNGRLGTVREDDTVELSQNTASEMESVFKALPDDWENFMLMVFDWNMDNEWSSAGFHGVKTLTAQDLLVHPSIGSSTKAYAWSHRSYDDLKRLFSEVRDDGVTRTFMPIDDEFHTLSLAIRKKGRRFRLAPVPSLAYRAKSPSFHIGPNILPLTTQNFPSTQYRKKIKVK